MQNKNRLAVFPRFATHTAMANHFLFWKEAKTNNTTNNNALPSFVLVFAVAFNVCVRSADLPRHPPHTKVLLLLLCSLHLVADCWLWLMQACRSIKANNKHALIGSGVSCKQAKRLVFWCLFVWCVRVRVWGVGVGVGVRVGVGVTLDLMLPCCRLPGMSLRHKNKRKTKPVNRHRKGNLQAKGA